MPYSYLLFDADNTLLDFDQAERRAFTAVFSACGYPSDEQAYQTYHECNKRCWEALEQGLCTRQELLFNRFEQTFAALRLSGDIPRVMAAYPKALAEEGCCLPEAKPLMALVAPLFTCVMITNGSTVIQNRRLQKSGLLPYFKNVYISESMGLAKPDPAYFDAVLKDCGVTDRSSVLVIGDSLSSDIQGGLSAGLDVCWFHPAEKKNKANLPINYEINRLSDLLPILGLSDCGRVIR